MPKPYIFLEYHMGFLKSSVPAPISLISFHKLEAIVTSALNNQLKIGTSLWN